MSFDVQGSGFKDKGQKAKEKRRKSKVKGEKLKDKRLDILKIVSFIHQLSTFDFPTLDLRHTTFRH